jgi:hypothetical protein
VRLATANATSAAAPRIMTIAISSRVIAPQPFDIGFARRVAASGKRRFGSRRRLRPVEAFAHFLAGLEERHAFAVDRHMLARSRIAAGPGGAILDGESAESAQLHPVAAGERGDDLAEDRVHDVLDVALVEMRVLRGYALNKLRLDHLGMLALG